MNRLLGIDFVRFCMVGASGFVINLILLTVLHKGLHLPLFISQLFSAEVALFSNFLLHQNWTYKHIKVTKSMPTMLWQFHATSWAAIIGSTVMVDLGVRLFNLNYVVALIFASGVAMGWNFMWTKLVIWKRVHHTPVTPSMSTAPNASPTGVEEAA